MTNHAIRNHLKALAKAITPPVLISFVRHVLSMRPQQNFKTWWTGFRNQDRLPRELVIMVDHYLSTIDCEDSSDYWNYLCRKNIEQIALYGLDNFKQTVSKNYFTWIGTGYDTPYSHNLVREVGSADSVAALSQIFKKHELLSIDESVQYNLITVLLHEYVRKQGEGYQLTVLEEPQAGNPLYITIDGKRVSQDILNSLLEFLAVTQALQMSGLRSIIEIGAGSGRTAFCFLSLIPNARYVVVDIPPALFISQTYLSGQFTDRKVFKFRPFSSFAEVAGELSQADIAFLTPDQLRLLPGREFDLFLAVDCLHEMKKSQVAYYFNEADRLARNIYFKCWESTEVPFDKIVWTSEDYPVNRHWKTVFKKPCKVPGGFFEAFFRIR